MTDGIGGAMSDEVGRFRRAQADDARIPETAEEVGTTETTAEEVGTSCSDHGIVAMMEEPQVSGAPTVLISATLSERVEVVRRCERLMKDEGKSR